MNIEIKDASKEIRKMKMVVTFTDCKAQTAPGKRCFLD